LLYNKGQNVYFVYPVLGIFDDVSSFQAIDLFKPKVFLY